MHERQVFCVPKYRFEEIAFNSTEKKKPVDSDKFTYIGLEHLDSGNLQVTRFGADTAPSGDKLVMKKGDVLFGKRRAYQKKVAIAPFDGIFSAHGMVLRPKAVVDPRFFPFFIASDYFLDSAIKISVGSLSPTINWRDLAQLEFELPDLTTQAKLADVMEALTRTKYAYEQLIAASDELVKSQFIEMIGTVKHNPHNLNVVSIGDICRIMNGYAFQSKKYVKNGVKVIRITNVQKGEIVDNDPQYYPFDLMPEFSNYMLEEGDLLLSLTGNCGRVGLLPAEMCPAALNQRVACLKSDEQQINKMFLFATLNTDLFEADCMAAASGSAQKNMSTEWLKKYKILLPPKEQQLAFANFVEQSDKSKICRSKSDNKHQNLWYTMSSNV